MLEYKWNGVSSYYLKDDNRLGSKAMSKILMSSLNKLFHRFDKNKALALWSNEINKGITSKSIIGNVLSSRVDISIDHSKKKYDTSLVNGEINYTAYSEPISVLDSDLGKMIVEYHAKSLSAWFARKIKEHFLSNVDNELLEDGVPKYIIGDIYSKLDNDQQCFIVDVSKENKMFRVGLCDNDGIISYVDLNTYNNPLEGLIAILEKLNTK